MFTHENMNINQPQAKWERDQEASYAHLKHIQLIYPSELEYIEHSDKQRDAQGNSDKILLINDGNDQKKG